MFTFMLTPSTRRLKVAGLIAALLVAGAITIPSFAGDREGNLRDLAAPTQKTKGGKAIDESKPHKHPKGINASAHMRQHLDQSNKNAISRSGETSGTADPTTAEQAARNRAYAAANRAALADPDLTTVPLREPRHQVPQTRYEMAGGCYSLSGQKIRFQATDLGSYLLYGTERTVLAAGNGGATAWLAKPTAKADWIVAKTGAGKFTFKLANGTALRKDGGAFTTGAEPTAFALKLASGCPTYPEISVNIKGNPHAGVSSFQEVRGYVDPHTHGMSHEFLGGRVICSPPWHRYGAAAALVDCPDHTLLGGRGAILEDFLSGNTPGTGHDAVGWPTFGYWPNPHSLTHQGVYYKWLERSWRGGLRIFTNLLVENNVLCELYPLKKNSCNDMDAVRLQAADMRRMQDYIDAQYGGPGKGWYRIVQSPFEARRVINQGKLAVVMGIETSVPFGCHVKLGIPLCNKAKIAAGLNEVQELGVSQMEITNKFDNAFTGVAGDEGTTGTITNLGNFYNTGSWLQMETCPEGFGDGVQDKDQGPLTAPDSIPEQDAIFGAIGQLWGPIGQLLPIYPAGPHCNKKGLSPLGEYLLNEMIDRHMLFDPDHMSVYARKQALALYEQAAADGRHPGILSSHSWSTPDAYPRILKLGGFVAPYAGDSTGFVEKWRQHLDWVDKHYYFGFGYGADMNGFGSQGNPRGADVENPVTYPFKGLNGITIDQQVSGERVYDINADGVSHYGLYPDWLRDAQILAGADGDDFAEDMSRGAEAYLQTWERAFGIDPDACRNPALRKTVTGFRNAIDVGMTTTEVMFAVGQPYTRLGRTFGTCAKSPSGNDVAMEVEFNSAGKVVAVRRG